MKFFLIVMFVYLVMFFSTKSSAEVAVIVNLENKNSIEDSEIRRVFLGKLKSLSDGSNVTPVNLDKGNATRKEFEKKVLKKSSSQIKAYWSKLVFSGKGNPPKELSTDAEIISFVANTPGAIAYINASSVNDSVHVIRVY